MTPTQEAAMRQAMEAWDDLPWYQKPTVLYPYMDALRATLAEPVQEPVAKCIDDICSEHLGRVEALDYLPRGTILFTTPPQRRPLSEDEVRDVLEAEFLGEEGPKRLWNDDLRVFRAAERAHNIT